MNFKKISQFLMKIRRKALFTAGWLVGLFVLFNYILLPAYVNQGQTLSVPKVVGLPLDQARAVLDSQGFEPVQAETRMDPRSPVGTVVLQNPQPDAVVKHGRRIYLTISGGEVVVEVPSLRGRSARDARFILERTGLTLGGLAYEASDAYPENTIMNQSLQPGTKVSKGTSVRVTVSRGKAQSEVNVPNLVGKSLNEAKQLLAKTGLQLGNITYQVGYDLLPNTVVDQFPRAGEQVADGQAVDLFVVKTGRPGETREN